MKRAAALVLVGLLCSRPAAGGDRRRLTLDDALALARQNHVDLSLARLNVEEFHSRYLQALAGGLFHVSGQASATRYGRKPVGFMGAGTIETARENVRQASLDFEQPLFAGGTVIQSVRAASSGRRASEELLEETDQAVAQAVKALFYAALLSSATARIQEDSLASALSHLDTIRARYDQGLDSDLMVQRQEVEVAEARANALCARNLHEMALISLQDALALSVDEPIEASGELSPPDGRSLEYDRLVSLAIERHPGLRAARDTTAFYEHRARTARGDFFPRLSLVGRWAWHAESDDRSFGSNERASSSSAGLLLRYPIFTGGFTFQEWRQAQVDLERAREMESDRERQVRVDVRRQWLNVIEALERARSQEVAIEQARNALRATEIRYRAGEASFLDLSDATLALNQIRIRHARAVHDYWVGLAALERATGGSLTGAQL